MLRRVIITTISILISALVVVAVPTPGQASYVADKDCPDFATQAAAQRFFLDQGGPGQDPHRLDADGDGIACETNPCPCSHDTTPGNPKPRAIRVVRVLDGETVQVRLPDGRRPIVKMIGANAPSAGNCGSHMAWRSLRAMLPVGTRVQLGNDSRIRDVDWKGRWWRYIHKSGDVNRRQVARGWARVYTSPPFARRASYRAAQADAYAARRGIWRSC